MQQAPFILNEKRGKGLKPNNSHIMVPYCILAQARPSKIDNNEISRSNNYKTLVFGLFIIKTNRRSSSKNSWKFEI